MIGYAWQNASGNGGDFGEAYPGYRWQLTQQNWQGDTTNIMTELAVEVFFPVQGDKAPHSVRLTTPIGAAGSPAQARLHTYTGLDAKMTPTQPFFIPCAAPGLGRRPNGLPAGRFRGKNAFTLIEIMVAAIAASIIMAAIYGIFFRAIKMRDNAVDRSREARLRARAVNVIRNDLRNALVSGGILASTLVGDSNGTDGADQASPGYLKFTTTTGKDAVTGTNTTSMTSGTAGQMYGDIQLVEYYVAKDPNSSGMASAGNLVRVVTRDLLDSNQTVVQEEQLLAGINPSKSPFTMAPNGRRYGRSAEAPVPPRARR